MATRERLVIALDDASLLAGGEAGDDLHEALVAVCRQVACLVEDGRDVVVTHGFGPLLGAALLRSALASEALPDVPFDVCTAEVQGKLGYLIGQTLGNEFRLRGIHRTVATVLTRVEVDPGDSAFFAPDRPVGPAFAEADARARADDEGWTVAEAGDGAWRRVVASPKPRRIVELDSIRALLETATVVVCCGGGGIPVVLDERAWYMGVAAVIDLRAVSALLAREIGGSLGEIA